MNYAIKTFTLRKDPRIMLIEFNRTQSNHKADLCERFGNVLLRSFRLTFGRFVKIDDNDKVQDEWKIKAISRIAYGILFMLICPISLLMTLAGLLFTHLSATYNKITIVALTRLKPEDNQTQTPFLENDKGGQQNGNKVSGAVHYQEIPLISNMKTEFEKACQIPEGAFGKAEWEKHFPVRIVEVPPLPANIHAILESADPCEPDKKLKETCMFFLRPQKVILHEDGQDKELFLNFDGVAELAQKATNPNRRIHCHPREMETNELMNSTVAEPGWVLMRKELIPNTLFKKFDFQKQYLKGRMEVPKVMDAILLNILAYVSDGKYLYGQKKGLYTRCQESFLFITPNNKVLNHLLVGGFGSKGILTCVRVERRHVFKFSDCGLSGSWRF